MPSSDTHLFSPIKPGHPPLCINSLPCTIFGIHEDGVATTWHLIHLGNRGSGAQAVIIMEATAIE